MSGNELVLAFDGTSAMAQLIHAALVIEADVEFVLVSYHDARCQLWILRTDAECAARVMMELYRMLQVRTN